MYVAVTERQATLTQVFSYGIVYLHFYEIKLIFLEVCNVTCVIVASYTIDRDIVTDLFFWGFVMLLVLS